MGIGSIEQELVCKSGSVNSSAIWSLISVSFLLHYDMYRQKVNQTVLGSCYHEGSRTCNFYDMYRQKVNKTVLGSCYHEGS